MHLKWANTFEYHFLFFSVSCCILLIADYFENEDEWARLNPLLEDDFSYFHRTWVFLGIFLEKSDRKVLSDNESFTIDC